MLSTIKKYVTDPALIEVAKEVIGKTSIEEEGSKIKKFSFGKISITNFRKIESFEYDLSKSLYLAGDRGSGKSSVLEAISWVLTGVGRNTKIVRRGEKFGSVALEINKGKDTFIIKRIRKGATTECVVNDSGDNKIFEGVKECEGFVKEIIGIDLELFFSTLYYSPRFSFRYTYQNPADVEKHVIKLCGLESFLQLEKTAKEMKKEESVKIDTIREMSGYMDIGEDEDELKESIKEQKAAGKKLEARLAEIKTEDLSDVQKQIRELTTKKESYAQYKICSEAKAEIETLNSELEPARKNAEKLKDRLQKEAEKRNEYTSQLSDIRSSGETQKNVVDRLKREYESIVKKIGGIEKYSEETTESIQHSIEETKVNIFKVTGSIARLSALIEANKSNSKVIVDEPNCPACGTGLEESKRKEIKDKLQADINLHEEEIEREKKMLANFKSALPVLESVLAAKEIEPSLSKEEAKLKELREKYSSIEKSAPKISETLSKEYNDAEYKVEKISRGIAEKESIVTRSKYSKLAPDFSMDDIATVDKNIADLNAKILNFNKNNLANESERNKINAEIVKLRSSLIANQNKLERFKDTKKLNDDMKALQARQELLESLIKEFGKKGIPKKESEDIIKSFSNRMNRVLSAISGETITAQFNADFTTTLTVNGQNDIDSGDLSDGEEHLINIAFMISSGLLLTNKLPFIAIDEIFDKQKDCDLKVILKGLESLTETNIENLYVASNRLDTVKNKCTFVTEGK